MLVPLLQTIHPWFHLLGSEFLLLFRIQNATKRSAGTFPGQAGIGHLGTHRHSSCTRWNHWITLGCVICTFDPKDNTVGLDSPVLWLNWNMRKNQMIIDVCTNALTSIMHVCFMCNNTVYLDYVSTIFHCLYMFLKSPWYYQFLDTPSFGTYLLSIVALVPSCVNVFTDSSLWNLCFNSTVFWCAPRSSEIGVMLHHVPSTQVAWRYSLSTQYQMFRLDCGDLLDAQHWRRHCPKESWGRIVELLLHRWFIFEPWLYLRLLEDYRRVGTNISPTKALLKMIFLFNRWMIC